MDADVATVVEQTVPARVTAQSTMTASALESACRELWVWSDPACDILRPVKAEPVVSQFEVVRPGHCTFSQPNWRWRLARHLPRRRREPDRWLRRARLVAGRLSGKTRLRKDPDVMTAYQLSQLPELALAELQARILADEGQDALARRCGVSVSAIEGYEKIFWDVRRRLDNAPWIRNTVIRLPATGVWPGKPVLPWLQHVATHYGLRTLEQFVAAMQRDLVELHGITLCLLAANPLPPQWKAWIAGQLLPIPDTARGIARLNRFLRLDGDQNRDRRRFQRLPVALIDEEIARSDPDNDLQLALRAAVEELPRSVRASLGWRCDIDLDKIANLGDYELPKPAALAT
jgi:hypothetical protein